MKKLLVSILTISAVFGQEDASVPFGTSFSADPNSYILWTSDGTPDNDGGTNLSPGGSTFQSGQINYTIGYFESAPGVAFTPTAANVPAWAGNYQEVASGYHLDYLSPAYRWYIQDNYTPVSSDAANKQIWVFAYNDLSQLGTSSGEALLFSDGQFFPTSNTVTIDVADNPTAEDDDFTIVWGRADRDYNNLGSGILEGAGYYSGQPAEGDFEIQTYSWTPIPEPSTSLLLFGGLAGLIARRKR